MHRVGLDAARQRGVWEAQNGELNRPMEQHTTQHSSVTGLLQRKDLEHEVVTSTLDGKLLFWDADYADATDCCDSPAGQPPEQMRDGRLAVRARAHDHPAASCVEGGA